MRERVIPILDHRIARPAVAASSALFEVTGRLEDRLARPLHDLRVSVTDRCNFRCTYCMPSEVFGKDYQFMPHAQMLSFEEITRVVRQFVAHGVTKVRLTGGEPLLRKGIEQLIEMLSSLTLPSGGTLDLTLTTNASLLARKAQALRDAGLKRLTVSLDALDEQIFQRMNGVDFPVADVLRGIEAASKAGFEDIKINAVIQRGVNDSQIVPLVAHFKGNGPIIRFIEFMDVGTSNGWRLDEVVSSNEVIERIQHDYPLDPIEANYLGEVAKRWRHRDGSGEIGVISSVTQAFCSDCSRARLTTEGRLYTCLFATHGTDLRSIIRGGSDDTALANTIAAVWHARDDRYSEIRSSLTTELPKIEMSYIGG